MLIQPKLPLPRSDARTVLELLDDLKAHVTKDHRVANMSTYICDVTGERGAPECGTTGCFAGWTVLLAGCTREKIRSGGGWTVNVAKLILGNDLDYKFGPKGINSFFNAGRGDACEGTIPGSKAHADALIARIDRFIRKNGGRKALAAKKLNRSAYAKFLSDGI